MYIARSTQPNLQDEVGSIAVTEKKRVLCLIKGLGLGGAEKLLELALPHWDRARFEYEVAYLLPQKADLVPALEAAGIRVFCLNQRREWDPRGFFRLVGLLRERRPDILHMHLPYPGILGRLATRLVPVKALVYTEHDIPDAYRWLTRRFHRLTFSWNNAVICISEAVRQSLLAQCKANGRVKVSTIYNGVNWEEITSTNFDRAAVREEFRIPAEDWIIVQVANFRSAKRHEDLLRAAKRILAAQQGRVTFLFVGGGPLESYLKALARDLRIEQKVVFTGQRPDAIRIAAAADLMVLPSLREALGISVLEGLALGLPIVATRAGGIPEIIRDNVEGLLVEPCDPDMLADKVLAILSDPVLYRTLSDNALRRAPHFDVKRMVQSTEALYDQALDTNVA